jgi:hypothetical protein
MLKKMLPFAAGAVLLALASTASAAQPLSDNQMDGVTAGASIAGALSEAGAVAFGEFQADTFTQTSTNVVKGFDILPLNWIAIGQSAAQAAATGGALFQTAIAVHSASQAAL